MIEYQFKAMDKWPGSRTERPIRGPFKSTFEKTLRKLERELRHLGAEDVLFVADCDASAIRRDGMLYADARLRSQGVVLSFTACSQAGKRTPLKFPCDTYDDWRTNLHAIALALEALRAVDRYGVTRRSEQYTGWSQLPPGGGIATAEWASTEDAMRFLSKVGDGPLLSSLKGDLRTVYRQAAEKAHPDKPGGSEALMAKVNRAKDFIEGAA